MEPPSSGNRITVLPNTQHVITIESSSVSETGKLCRKYSPVFGNNSSVSLSNSETINGFDYRFVLPVRMCICQELEAVGKEIEEEIRCRGEDGFKEFEIIVSDYCDGGNLRSYMSKHGKPSEEALREIFVEIALGLNYIHSHQYVHGKLNMESIYVRYLKKEGSGEGNRAIWGGRAFDIVIGGFNSVIPIQVGTNIQEIKNEFSFGNLFIII